MNCTDLKYAELKEESGYKGVLKYIKAHTNIEDTSCSLDATIAHSPKEFFEAAKQVIDQERQLSNYRKQS